MKEVSVVTGGAGFIGHHLVKSLSAVSAVVVLDNFSRGEISRLEGLGDEVIIKHCDLTVYEEVELALKEFNVNVIYHLAAINGTNNFYKIPIKIMDVGILGCLNVLRFMKKFGCRVGVFASSAEVYQNPEVIPTPEDVPLVVPSVNNPRYSYGLSKIFTEYYAYHYGIQHDLDISIFRPHNVYGPNMGLQHVIPEFIMEFLRSPPGGDCVRVSVKGSLNSTRAFCYVDDIVKGLKLLRKNNKGVNVYNLGNTDVISMRDLLGELASLFGTRFELEHIQDTHLGGTLQRCPDIAKAQSLGFMPSVDLRSGLKRTIDWYATSYRDLLKGKNDLY